MSKSFVTFVLFCILCAMVVAWPPVPAEAQGLTGTLIGSVKDEQGGVLRGAVVRVSSPAVIGRELRTTTNEKGQLRFPALPPGTYALDIEMGGFATYHEEDIRVGAGATIERTAVLKVAGIAESVTVEAGSRIEARGSGLEARFGSDDLRTIPTGRLSMFDLIRAAPGISPTSPASGTTTSVSATSVSALGSSVNENQFLIDGTNFTCPCSGVARSEPGIDFIQEVQVQTVGASAEFGNLQGAVINVVTRQGGDKFLYDASFYAQPAGLTSQPVVRPVPNGGSQPTSGYTRHKYRDFTTNLGGPAMRDRLWFFGGYQHLRDYDSQPGVDPKFPRTYEQDKGFGKLTWRLTPGLQLMQSFHQESWVNPPLPTIATPFEATTRNQASVPAITFGHLTHTWSANTVWDLRVGRFVVHEKRPPSTGDLTRASHNDRVTGVTSGAPATFGERNYFRTTTKATLTHYQVGLLGADHQWKVGGSLEEGEHRHSTVIPTGVRFVDNNGQPFQSISSAPSPDGGQSITASAFASDAITFGDRLTLSVGVRFDHGRAISQDLPALDAQGRDTDTTVGGLGTLYTWNIVSPRLGVATKLTADGRTMMRASYGRFSQGVLTGEYGSFHPGIGPVTTRDYVAATGGYTSVRSVVDSKTQLQLDPSIRAPHSDEYSIGIDREIGRQLGVAIAYIHKEGSNFIGWTESAGEYRQETRALSDGRVVPVMALVSATGARRFRLTNPDGYSLTYHGLVTTVEKRRSHGWQAFGSYTFSRASGLQVSSGTSAAGEQLSTLTSSGLFGRDPNDLTNARGRLANDRPHMFRAMGSVDVPRTGLVVAANVRYFSGKPWAASTTVLLPQGDRRILLEAPGSRRLSSQSLLDVRLSRALRFGTIGQVELLMDLLNLLNDAAEEGLATDNFFSATFGQPTVFMNPRRVMVSARVNLGR